LGLPLALLLENHSSQQRLYSLKVRIGAGLSCHPLIDAPCNTSHVLLVRRLLLPLNLSLRALLLELTHVAKPRSFAGSRLVYYTFLNLLLEVGR